MPFFLCLLFPFFFCFKQNQHVPTRDNSTTQEGDVYLHVPNLCFVWLVWIWLGSKKSIQLSLSLYAFAVSVLVCFYVAYWGCEAALSYFQEYPEEYLEFLKSFSHEANAISFVLPSPIDDEIHLDYRVRYQITPPIVLKTSKIVCDLPPPNSKSEAKLCFVDFVCQNDHTRPPNALSQASILVDPGLENVGISYPPPLPTTFSLFSLSIYLLPTPNPELSFFFDFLESRKRSLWKTWNLHGIIVTHYAYSTWRPLKAFLSTMSLFSDTTGMFPDSKHVFIEELFMCQKKTHNAMSFVSLYSFHPKQIDFGPESIFEPTKTPQRVEIKDGYLVDYNYSCSSKPQINNIPNYLGNVQEYKIVRSVFDSNYKYHGKIQQSKQILISCASSQDESCPHSLMHEVFPDGQSNIHERSLIYVDQFSRIVAVLDGYPGKTLGKGNSVEKSKWNTNLIALV